MNATAAYDALDAGAALFDRSDRVRLEVAGPDRAKFLHNLTTNDVKRLAAGRGHEAFVTSPQGKTLAYVALLACDDKVLLRSDPGTLAAFRPHLEKYGLFDDVALDDAGPRTFEFHLAGPGADDLLRPLVGDLPGADDLSHVAARLGDAEVRIVRESPTGRPGLTLIGPAEAGDAVAGRLRDAGAVVGDASTFEAARIEAGTPTYGRDVAPENLPQEVGRDARAINFVKGCYLGQETVARIDALGHVNKHLKGLAFPPGPVPPAGSPVETAEGKAVGHVTSSAASPGWSRPVALAYLRTAVAEPGTEVVVRFGEETVTGIVADLPHLPPSSTSRH
jgi:hypothetical protein